MEFDHVSMSRDLVKAVHVLCHNRHGPLLLLELRQRKVTRVKRLLSEAGAEGRFVEMVYAAPDEGKRLHDTLLGFAPSGEAEENAK